MAYVVLARKWRPRNFEEMVGQDHIAQTIRNAIEKGRIAHAYLFTGTRGVGKTTSARILAKALNCSQGPTAVPCEQCENCRGVSAGTSMDVLEIDGASNNGVDDIRDLREQVKYAPMGGKYKIYIIDEVHMLTKQAFNALLKTLEEPPPHVVFIFATTEANKVPHTILSRVQRFDFKRISESHIRERLEFICTKEDIHPEAEALEAIARKADGSMRDALSLFDQVFAFSGSELSMQAVRQVLSIPPDEMYETLLGAIAGQNCGACFQVIDDFYRQGIEVSEFLLGFGEYLRDFLFSRQTGATAQSMRMAESRFQKLQSQWTDLRNGDIIRYSKIISDLLAVLKTIGNPRLAVEMGFARMASLDRVVLLSQLLKEGQGSEIRIGAEERGSGGEGLKKKVPPDNSTVTIRMPIQGPEDASPTLRALSPIPPSHSTIASPTPSSPIASLRSVPTSPIHSPAHTRTQHAPVSQPAGSHNQMIELTEEIFPAAFAAASEPETQSDQSAHSPFLAPEEAGEEEIKGETPTFLDAEAEGETLFREKLEDGEEGEQRDEIDNEVDDLIMEEPDEDTEPREPEQSNSNSGIADEQLSVPPVPSLNALQEVWPALVEEYMRLRPLVGSSLHATRIELMEPETGEPPIIQVLFGNSTAFSLAEDDADLKRSLQGFVASKLTESEPFRLQFIPDAQPLAEKAGEAPPVDSAPKKLSAEELMLREPILQVIRDVFDGRVLE